MKSHFTLLILLLLPAIASRADTERTWVSFTNRDNTLEFKYDDGLITPLTEKPDSPYSAQIQFGAFDAWPRIAITPSNGKLWDLSGISRLSMRVRNVSPVAGTLYLRVEDKGGDYYDHCSKSRTQLLAAGAEDIIELILYRRPGTLPAESQVFGMHGKPGRLFDLNNTVQIMLYTRYPDTPLTFHVSDIYLHDAVSEAALDPKTFFPFVDSFGQYKHESWPGKVVDAAELQADIDTESASTARAGLPSEGWTQYGGWANGPTLKATGQFRTEKYNGKWWLIDPEGKLFWSHGVDSINHSQDSTPVTNREHYFADLPSDGPLHRFIEPGYWKHPPGYYRRVPNYQTFNFRNANLYRKYGENWKEAWYDSTIIRLKSWRLNTVGAFYNDALLTPQRRIPYARLLTHSIDSRPIEASSGHWVKFPDPYDASFRNSLRKTLTTYQPDPWRIGFFFRNELAWGDRHALALATLMSPPEQPAKAAFIRYLKTTYPDIQSFNMAWRTKHADWDSLLASRERPPFLKAASNDLVNFTGLLADTFFRICKEELEKQLPGALFLGCRFAGPEVSPQIIQAAARHADAVSFNLYQRNLDGLVLPAGSDKPVIIGEFQFGALDHGAMHEGLVRATNQQTRGQAYQQYLRSALRNPLVVGVHWFQYADQPISGRPDGENFQAGLIDITDRPHVEFTDAVREIGDRIYSERLNDSN